MLVKFGKLGKTITEYLLKDEATLDDLLDAANEELEDDDDIYELQDDCKELLDPDGEGYLKENATYILERIKLTAQEEKIMDLIRDEWGGDMMSTQNQKDFVKKLLACGWDK